MKKLLFILFLLLPLSSFASDKVWICNGVRYSGVTNLIKVGPTDYTFNYKHASDGTGPGVLTTHVELCTIETL